jgi:hypothetical protein
VIVLRNGILLGGDDALLYSGTYEQQRGGRFSATVTTSRHTENRPTLFGLDQATMSFAGSVVRERCRLRCIERVPRHPVGSAIDISATVLIKLGRRAAYRTSAEA